MASWFTGVTDADHLSASRSQLELEFSMTVCPGDDREALRSESVAVAHIVRRFDSPLSRRFTLFLAPCLALELFNQTSYLQRS